MVSLQQTFRFTIVLTCMCWESFRIQLPNIQHILVAFTVISHILIFLEQLHATALELDIWYIPHELLMRAQIYFFDFSSLLLYEFCLLFHFLLLLTILFERYISETIDGLASLLAILFRCFFWIFCSSFRFLSAHSSKDSIKWIPFKFKLLK